MSIYFLLAIGLFNSIMFPTIFSLATKGLGKFTSQASGIICMAIVGGAIVPLIQGYIADIHSLGILTSYTVPMACYIYILIFAVFCAVRERSHV
ncbi:Homolog of fucose/glucose/galactose permeases [Helicobacter heilmannii ASB1.4]|nr:Homolog of fucose/glucose/galactose permeases [Helicobacter heilmannii ASB1.4]